MFKAVVKSREDEDICILIKVDNHSYNYICDCGEAKDLTVKECQNTRAVFISHTHIDHFVNFDAILRHQIGIKRLVTIVGPVGIIQQVQNRIKSYCWNLIDQDAITYEVREVGQLGSYKTIKLRPPLWEIEEEKVVESDQVFIAKEFHVECEILDHNTDSIAYLFKAKDKVKIDLPSGIKGGKWVGDLKKAYEDKAGDRMLIIDNEEYRCKDFFHLIKEERGRQLGIVMDHAANEVNHQRILSRFSNCDEVLIEAFYKDEDADLAQKNHHSYAAESGRIMKEANVVEAIPVHFSRKYSIEERAELIGQFERARSL